MQVEKVWKVYRRGESIRPVLKGINLEVKEGEFRLMIGPSGSVKATLLKLMGLLDSPSSGDMMIDDIWTSKLSRSAIARVRNRKIGFVFQSFNLIPELTVMENILLPTWIRGGDRSAAKRDAWELVKTVGLEKRVRNSANQLSGGEMQRVAIARALINRPTMVLADEPTGNLDSKSAEQVMELFKTLNEENGQTFVLVSHNPDHGGNADRIASMIDGQLESDMHLPHHRAKVFEKEDAKPVEHVNR
jgi:putative ABC transport system ATP-binding protein